MGRDLFSVNHGPKLNHPIPSLLSFELIPGKGMFSKPFEKANKQQFAPSQRGAVSQEGKYRAGKCFLSCGSRECFSKLCRVVLRRGQSKQRHGNGGRNTVELEQLQGRRRGSGEAGSVQRRRLTQLKIAKMVQE